MNLAHLVVAALLAVGVVAFAFTSLGLLLSRDTYDQIHYLAPGSLIGSIAIAAAVLVHEGFSQAGVKSILIAILLLVSNPVLSHATARAARIRRKQQLPPKPGEKIRSADVPE